MRRVSRILAVGFLCCAALHGLVAAGPGVPPAPAPADAEIEAKRLYQEGTKYYSLGEWTLAVDNYKAAYKLVQKPLLLYNIAQAYRLAKNFEQSLFFYKSYLNAQPEASNRAEIEGRIADLEKQVAMQEETSKKPPNGIAPSPEQAAGASEAGALNAMPPPTTVPSDTGRSRPIYKKWWFWAGVGAVAVGATVAVVALSGSSSSGAPDAELGTRPAF